MQKIATRVFIYASIAFGIIGILMILSGASNAGEMSQELILAMTSRLPLRALFNKVYPYPTGSRINKQLTSQIEERRLTGFAIKVLRIFYRLR